jgi:hypothetical protein
MNSNKKRLFIFGFCALVLLGIATSNSAIIRYIDSAYTQIIASTVSNKKAINVFERNCNSIQNSAVSMLLTEDTVEIACHRKEIYSTFITCDKYLMSLENSKFPQEYRDLIVKLRSAYISYKEACAGYTIKINEQEPKKNAYFVTTILQKEFTSLLSVIDAINTGIDSAVVTDSKSLTRQNNLFLTFITKVGIIPLAFWGLLLLATLLWTSLTIRKIRPDQ